MQWWWVLRHAIEGVLRFKTFVDVYRASTSTANTGSVTAGNHANSGDVADSYQHIPKPNFEAAAEPKKFT